MPSTSPARIASRRWDCDGDQADSVVCGSSTMHQLRAHDLPVGAGVVLPADVRALHAAGLEITTPEAFEPAMVGRTIRSDAQSIRVGSPLYFWPFWRLVIRSRHWIG